MGMLSSLIWVFGIHLFVLSISEKETNNKIKSKPVENLTGTVCGTPLYLRYNKTKKLFFILHFHLTNIYLKSPEVHTAQYSNKIDQWSYGLIIYELMNRGLKESSFSETVTKESLKKGIQVVIPDNWDPNYKLIISKCMSHDPKERPTWTTILELLEKCNQN